MIPAGSMIRFKYNYAGYDVALVLRSYMCAEPTCCNLSPEALSAFYRAGEVIDILWNNGQRDTEYHLEGLSSDQVEVITQ